MKTVLKSMQKKSNKIPEDLLPVFENIVQKYEVLNQPSLGSDCEEEFRLALEEHLTAEQRFLLFEQNGGCKGTGRDKERIHFANENAVLPLVDRIKLFNVTYGRNIVLNDDNTITVAFSCTHGYYKKAREQKNFTIPKTILSYFEQCAGGRLYEYQKALGIKLKIKSVDITPLEENIVNPVLFTFEIVN